MNNHRIWITWQEHRRSQSLSREIGAELYELISRRGRLRRYLSLCTATLRIIRRERPSVVFAQNPSIVLSFLIICLRPIFRYTAVIDEHNAGLFPLEGRNALLNWCARFIARKADIAIVTNENLAAHVRSIGGKPVVLPDPLPRFDGVSDGVREQSRARKENLEILFICTWSTDEPYLELIEAAAQVADDLPIRISITGNPKSKLDGLNLPINISLTGFIPDSEYVMRLASSDAVVVLTTRADCLNCGAYEAVSLGKPGILSDTEALRGYFRSGFLFSTSESRSIAVALSELNDQWLTMRQEVMKLREELDNEYSARLEPLENMIQK